MQTSHKLTRIFFALMTLIVLAAGALAQAADIDISDQKAGSALVYPYYTSDSQSKGDTRVTLSNVGTQTVAVHLFFFDKSCNQADTFVCLTPNASIAMKASEFDPEVQGGWLLAVAVNAAGRPLGQNLAEGSYNALIGNAFVNSGNEVGNYGAEAIRDFTTGRVIIGGVTDPTQDTITFNAPTQFAVEIQSPVDAAGQKIVTVGLSGSITDMTLKGAGHVGIGQLYNGNEKPFGSFSKLLTDACRAEATITATNPRVPLGLGVLIPSGQVGTMKFNVIRAVGLLITPKNNKWSGIRTLHKTAQAPTTIALPAFIPGCVVNN